MSRYLRYLRIAFSATCLIACVLLIALWVRSYYCRVNIQASILPNRTFQCSFLPTRMYLHSYPLVTSADRKEWITGFWQVYKNRPNANGLNFDNWDYPGAPTFKFSISEYRPGDMTIHFPYWAPIVVLASAASLCWIRWSTRFTLRTLLIATTLVAVVLGTIVWFSR